MNYIQQDAYLNELEYQYDLANEEVLDDIRFRDFCIGYDAAKAKYAKSDILMFYYGEKIDKCRFVINQVLNFTDIEMEQNHDFIQWLFPTNEQSQFNLNAPLLTDSDTTVFKTNINVKNTVAQAIDRFMYFLGFNAIYPDEINTKVLDNLIIYEPTTYATEIMLNEFNHNHMRITRMIKFLKLINHWQLELVFNAVHDNCAVEDSKKYWKEAYNG